MTNIFFTKSDTVLKYLCAFVDVCTIDTIQDEKNNFYVFKNLKDGAIILIEPQEILTVQLSQTLKKNNTYAIHIFGREDKEYNNLIKYYPIQICDIENNFILETDYYGYEKVTNKNIKNSEFLMFSSALDNEDTIEDATHFFAHYYNYFAKEVTRFANEITARQKLLEVKLHLTTNILFDRDFDQEVLELIKENTKSIEDISELFKDRIEVTNKELNAVFSEIEEKGLLKNSTHVLENIEQQIKLLNEIKTQFLEDTVKNKNVVENVGAQNPAEQPQEKNKDVVATSKTDNTDTREDNQKKIETDITEDNFTNDLNEKIGLNISSEEQNQSEQLGTNIQFEVESEAGIKNINEEHIKGAFEVQLANIEKELKKVGAPHLVKERYKENIKKLYYFLGEEINQSQKKVLDQLIVDINKLRDNYIDNSFRVKSNAVEVFLKNGKGYEFSCEQFLIVIKQILSKETVEIIEKTINSRPEKEKFLEDYFDLSTIIGL